MKIFRLATILSLSAIMSTSIYAETTHQKPKQPAKQAQSTSAKKVTNTQKKAVDHKKPVANSEASSLKRFTDSLELKFIGANVKKVDNQDVVNFSYQLKNKSKNTIKKVHWATIFGANQQAILILDDPILFEKGLKPSAVLPLTYTVPFSQLPKIAQQIFADPKNEVSLQFQAKSIDFSNGKKITVK